MTSRLRRDRRGLERKSCEDRGRDWSGVYKPKDTWNPQKLEEAGGIFPSSLQRPSNALQAYGPQNCERRHFCCFKPPPPSSGESSAPGRSYSERNRDVRKDLLLTWEKRAISLGSVSSPGAAPQHTLTHREGQARGIPSSHHLLTHRLPLTQLPPTPPPTHLWPRWPVPSMLPNPVVLTASVLEAPQLVHDPAPCSPDSPPISPSV